MKLPGHIAATVTLLASAISLVLTPSNALATPTLPASSSAAAPSLHLRILSTSDVHGQFMGKNYFTQQPVAAGYAHLAKVIEEARAEADLHVLIDNGDLIQGSPMTDWMVTAAASEQPLPLTQVMNALQFDVANLGNHEFNYGLDYLAQAYAGANFPLLSANLKPLTEAAKNKLKIAPWVMLEKQPAQAWLPAVKVAVIGVLPPQIMQWDAHYLQHQVAVEGMYEAAQRSVQEAQQQGAEVIIIAAHTGLPKNSRETHSSEQDVWSLAQIDGVDAIAFGHQHELFPGTDAYQLNPDVDSEAGTIHGVAASQPGAQGEYLGVIDLYLQWQQQQGWQVSRSKSHLRAAAATPDTSIQALLAEADEATMAYMKQPIGHTEVALSHRLSRLQPTTAMQLLHDAQRWYVERYLDGLADESSTGTEQPWQQLPLLSAAAPFFAATSAEEAAQQQFTFINAGPVTIGDVGNLYRYPNTLDVVKISVAQLQQWLETSAAALRVGSNEDPYSWVESQVPSYNFDTIAGIKYQIDVSQPIGQRVTILDQIATEAVLVVTNNYRANGGGDFAGLDGSQIVFSSPDQIQHILIEYLKQLPQPYLAGQQLDKNWIIVDRE